MEEEDLLQYLTDKVLNSKMEVVRLGLSSMQLRLLQMLQNNSFNHLRSCQLKVLLKVILDLELRQMKLQRRREHKMSENSLSSEVF
jgi:hypothetical protein